MPAQYHISLPDPSKARGNDPDLSFHSQGAAGFAEELQDALRSGALFERWKAKQPDPDAVEPQWGVTDPEATVTGEQKDLRINRSPPPASTAMCSSSACACWPAATGNCATCVEATPW